MEALLHGAVDALLPLLHTLQNILEHQQLTFPVDLRVLLFQARAEERRVLDRWVLGKGD